MVDVGLVRPSRDGDQFHYLWAARQCLGLLPGRSTLVAVTIEGASVREQPSDDPISGDEIIDVGLYHGSESVEEASAIHYVQLKHSTKLTDTPWTASGLDNTIKGFASRYAELTARLSPEDVAKRFRFKFVTNRPIAASLVDALAVVTAPSPMSRVIAKTTKSLRSYTGLSDEQASSFYRLFDVESITDGLWMQRHLLVEDARAYLPDADYEAPIELKELVTQKALSAAAADPAIRRHDVLRVLKVSPDDLFPAPNHVEQGTNVFARAQETELHTLIRSASAPIVLHADGGVGKSVMAARLAASMEAGSLAIHYDCFGDGLYRSAHNFRHRPRDAFIQIANELAAVGLCHPLIPAAHADIKAYLRAFTHRLAQVTATLRADDPGAVLCLIIDASDNAEMVARAEGETSSFVRHLLHAPMPDGVRLVFTSRTHRLHELGPLDGKVQVAVRPFDLGESATHLRQRYPDATVEEVAEFHYLSSQNPRVQALAMDARQPLVEMLGALGPSPTSVDAALSGLLSGAIDRLKSMAGAVGAGQIDDICRGLAVLRPLVPIEVLSALTGVGPSAIRSFVYDLGRRPLAIRGSALHFLDEPAETWFREHYAPDAGTISAFVERLRPLATTNAYVAGVIPHLLLEAGRHDELVRLALSGDDLPEGNPLERRDVEFRRVLFALKASLRLKDYTAAAKLALKAGGDSAGDDRQADLLQSNVHLVAALLQPEQLLELVARRSFGSNWKGSRHAYSAAVLSDLEEVRAEGRSHLRMSMEWLQAWARSLKRDEDDWARQETVSDHDRAALALAALRLNGAKAASSFLRRWRHRSISFTAGRLLAEHLCDVGEHERLNELALAARNNVWLLLALAWSARAVGRTLPSAPLARLLKLLADRRLKVEEIREYNRQHEVADAVAAAIELALGQLPRADADWAAVLARYLPASPPNDLTSRFSMVERAAILRPYALHAALRGVKLQLQEVAPKEINKEMSGRSSGYGSSSEAMIFRSDVGGLIPWLTLAAEMRCGRTPDDLPAAVTAALADTEKAMRQSHREPSNIRNDVAVVWFNLIADAEGPKTALCEQMIAWKDQVSASIWPQTLMKLCWRAARTSGLKDLGIDLATEAGQVVAKSHDPAETRIEQYAQLARAVYEASPAEATSYFDQGIAIADRVGEENIERWTALLRLADAAGESGRPRPETAYRLSRAAALVYEYVARDKYFDWDETIRVLAGLCPSSSLAILGRWRDRRFGSKGRLLPYAVDRMVEDRHLPPLALVALAGLETDWKQVETLSTFLSGGETSWRRRRGVEVAHRYMRVSGLDEVALQRLASLASREGVQLFDLQRLIDLRKCATTSTASKMPVSNYQREQRQVDWSEIFKDVDVVDASALLGAYHRLRSLGPPSELDEFCRQSILRMQPGQEAIWLRAMAERPDSSLYELERILGVTPLGWRKRVAFRHALRDVVLSACRREPDRVSFDQYRRFSLFEWLIGERVVTKTDILDAVLAGYTEQADAYGSRGLFQLIEALSYKLTPAQADDSLVFGLDLVEPTLSDEHGDGPWRPELAPTGTVVQALAGYVWAGLASPAAAERWEYAHVIRCAVELDWTEFLSEVACMAEAGEGGPFADAALEFYLWHARQWLAIGLARGGRDAPDALKPFAAWLLFQARGQHVVVRAFAAEAYGHWAATSAAQGEGAALTDAVNTPRLPLAMRKGWLRDVARDADEEDDTETAEREALDRYYFGHDIDRYWMEPLGRVFGLSGKAIERRMLRRVREDLGWQRGGWRDDARQTRRVFGHEETAHSHGSHPRVDTLPVYHGYHALMLTAGTLLEELPVGRQIEASKDDFEEWLEDHLLSRRDGRWLLDRLDPDPIGRTEPVPTTEADWPWLVDAAHLDAQFRTREGDHVLWGHWSTGSDDHVETIDVRSALVSEDKAEALLTALQSASDPTRYTLPDADEVITINGGALTGWVRDEAVSHRLDEYDPWAEAVRHPAAAPDATIIEALRLTGDLDGRSWHGEAGEVLRSDSWTIARGYGSEAERVAHWRFSGNAMFLKRLMATHPGTVLICKVATQREPPKYRRRDGAFEAYPWPYVRYILLNADGVARAL